MTSVSRKRKAPTGDTNADGRAKRVKLSNGGSTKGFVSLKTLSVSGVRSFAPTPVQTIHFEKPLTILVGPNGVGKTSIVEALRFATTGTLPPGPGGLAARQHAFIHQPVTQTLPWAKPSLASVTLAFTDVDANVVSVKRKVSLTMETNLSLHGKSYPAHLTVTPSDGSAPSVDKAISKRDINSTLTQYLNVSPAILDSVLFVHQADAQWPLDKQLLKDRVDKILETEVQTKALEEFSKCRKQLERDLTHMELEQSKWANVVQNKQNFMLRLNELEGQAEEAKLKMDSVRADKGKLEVQVAQAAAKQDEANLNVKVAPTMKPYLRDLNLLLQPYRDQIQPLAPSKRLISHTAVVKAWLKELQQRVSTLTKQNRTLQQQRDGHETQVETAGRAKRKMDTLQTQNASRSTTLARQVGEETRETLDQRLVDTELRIKQLHLGMARAVVASDTLDKLNTDGGTCPVCVQPLGPEQRERTLNALQGDMAQDRATIETKLKATHATLEQLRDKRQLCDQLARYEAEYTTRQKECDAEAQRYMEAKRALEAVRVQMQSGDVALSEAAKQAQLLRQVANAERVLTNLQQCVAPVSKANPDAFAAVERPSIATLLSHVAERTTHFKALYTQLTKPAEPNVALDQAQTRLAQLRATYHQQSGRYETVVQQCEHLTRQLEDPQFREADVRHAQVTKRIDLYTKVVDDMIRYHRARADAIVRYHHETMTEINRILDELWKQSYQGDDIESIRIVSERRGQTNIYDYRVMMRMTGATMQQDKDMRAYASRGQQVLAALMIRFAFARAFSLRTNLLVLDEPTTNLDAEHVRMLAATLNRIIALHQDGNLQLVVITHNQQFVEQLCKSQHADHYYRITRDPHTTITKEAIRAL